MPQFYIFHVYRSQFLIHHTFSFPNLHSSLKFSLIILTIAFFKILIIILKCSFFVCFGAIFVPYFLMKTTLSIFFIEVTLDQN